MTVLRKQVGQLIIAGLEGEEATPLEKSWLKIVEPGGVILFRRNIAAAAQTHQLLAEVSSVSTTPIFRCVDLEGGLVDRLRDAIAPMPSLAAVAASGNRSAFLKHGKLIGREARSFGFNVVLAPVLDLALPESSSTMRTRTVFAQPAEVIAYAEAFLSGLESASVLGCGKHFPGLGGGTLDSHHATPVIERTPEQMWQADLLPYRKLRARLPLVMISHASYPASGDPKPASISRHWITDVLIRKMGYRGLILSDDLEMGGILSQTSIEDAALGAIAAGAHLVEICKDAGLVLRAYEALLLEAERSAAFRRAIESACRKVVLTKGSLSWPASNKPPSPAQIEKLRAQVRAFAERYPEPQAEKAK